MARVVGSGPTGVYRQLWRHAQKVRRLFPLGTPAPETITVDKWYLGIQQPYPYTNEVIPY